MIGFYEGKGWNFRMLPLTASTWGAEEISAALAVLSSGKTTMGDHVRDFETQFAKKFGSKFALMCNSGSSANLLAVAAIAYSKYQGKTKNLEIIVPAISWSTTYFPIQQLGFNLKIVDIDPASLNISVEAISRAISKNTVGIVVVNLLGQPAELNEIQSLCRQHNLFLIEDNCESMGAELHGKSTGTFGDIGTFSFFYSHHINTMEGGMCLTDNLDLYEFMHSLRAHGWTRGLPELNSVYNKVGDEWHDQFCFVLPGYNLRPLEVSAAIGKVQLAKFDTFLMHRRANLDYFRELFGTNQNIRIQTGNGRSSAFAFSLVLTGSLKGKREELLLRLKKIGIESRPVVTGNFARQPVIKYLNVSLAPLENADYVHKHGLYIGNHHFEIRKQLDQLKEIVEIVSNR